MEEFNFDNIQICLDEYALQFVEHLKTLMQTKDSRGYNKVASGNLLASLKTRQESDSNNARIKVYLVHLPYLKYLESGTKPHYPPFAPILKWVRDKGLPTGNGKKGSLPTDKQLAYLVQRKIGREGTAAVPLVRQTQEALNPTFEKRLEEALEKDINEFTRVNPSFTISLRFK